MDKLPIALLAGLNEQDTNRSTRDLLLQTGAILMENLGADILVGYELISETGGVPKPPPVFLGDLFDETAATLSLSDASQRSELSQLIRRWTTQYYEDPSAWDGQWGASEPSTLARFIDREKIKSLIFLPISQTNRKLAALLLCFRRPFLVNAAQRLILDACRSLIGTQMAQLVQSTGSLNNSKRREAVAHTLYGGVAVVYQGQIEALEAELVKHLGQNLPTSLASHLEKAKRTVFEEMRNLVIEASGDLLVDLEKMTLAKALNTAAAALRRAWPPGQSVIIDISPIPPVIERQPAGLRQLLYALILEAVGNSIKHGGPAPYINIDLNWANNRVYVQVIDHGKGFDRAAQPLSKHGLGFWQSYVVEHLAGTFEIASQPGYGTVVSAEIPVIPVRAIDYA